MQVMQWVEGGGGGDIEILVLEDFLVCQFYYRSKGSKVHGSIFGVNTNLAAILAAKNLLMSIRAFGFQHPPFLNRESNQ